MQKGSCVKLKRVKQFIYISMYNRLISDIMRSFSQLLFFFFAKQVIVVVTKLWIPMSCEMFFFLFMLQMSAE